MVRKSLEYPLQKMQESLDTWKTALKETQTVFNGHLSFKAERDPDFKWKTGDPFQMQLFFFSDNELIVTY